MLLASAVRMRVEYSGDIRLTLDGERLSGQEPVTLEDGAEVGMPGIGVLRFDLPQGGSDDDIETLFAEALASEAEALAQCGVADLAGAPSRKVQ